MTTVSAATAAIASCRVAIPSTAAWRATTTSASVAQSRRLMRQPRPLAPGRLVPARPSPSAASPFTVVSSRRPLRGRVVDADPESAWRRFGSVRLFFFKPHARRPGAQRTRFSRERERRAGRGSVRLDGQRIHRGDPSAWTGVFPDHASTGSPSAHGARVGVQENSQK